MKYDMLPIGQNKYSFRELIRLRGTILTTKNSVESVYSSAEIRIFRGLL